MEFTGQAFFFSQTRQIADVVDEHSTVNGHGASNGGVFGKGAYDD
jgi:hypothetical protein